MPVFENKEFKPFGIPANVHLETDVFYLSTTNEVFLTYDAYFERIVHLNSSVWSCSVTGRSELTFDEALESEENALRQIDVIQAALQRAIFYAVYHFSGRTRLDDVVSDIFAFITDRYFVGEELNFKDKHCRVRVLEVKHTAQVLNTTCDEIKASTSVSLEENADKTYCSSGKRKIKLPKCPPPDEYCYNVKFIKRADGSPTDSDNVLQYDNVKHTQLSRDRLTATKVLIKMLLKFSTENINHIVVKQQHVSDFMLDSTPWYLLFDGPLPIFERTAKPTVKKEHKPMSSQASSEIKEKKKGTAMHKMISEQQQKLALLFEEAQTVGVKDIERWKQNFYFLSVGDIHRLQTEIKQLQKANAFEKRKKENHLKEVKELEKKNAIEKRKEEIRLKEEERKRATEKRKKDREELAERKKPRDDLQCDDLKVLPTFNEFVLPDWVPAELYQDLLLVHNFFCCFSELLTGPVFTLNTISMAILLHGPDNSSLVELFKVLLRARTECADEEDGDEADVDNAEEIGHVINCDLDHKEYGELIREKSKKHEYLRETFGFSVRHLPITSMTITEVIRLTLETSGYYASGDLKDRQNNRGSIKCYEDYGFQFVLRNKELMEQLKNASIFDLTPRERLSIMLVIILQLLTYVKFRELMDQRFNRIVELKRDLRLLRETDRMQEREIFVLKEAETKAGGSSQENAQTSLSKKPSKTLLQLRGYLRNLNEGRSNRLLNDFDAKDTLLKSIPYREMDSHEVDEFRELQRELFREKQSVLIYEIFKLQSLNGMCFLGRDRAFRSYYYLSHFSMFIIENPIFEDIVTTCNEPTPLNSDYFDENLNSSANEKQWDRQRILRFACTAKPENCPVHNSATCSTYDILNWYYFVEKNGIEHLLNALNLRGFREMDLAENIIFFKEIFEKNMNKLAEKVEGADFLRRHFELASELIDPDKKLIEEGETAEMRMLNDFRRMLLELEENLFAKDNTRVKCANVDREEWRRCLVEKGNTFSFHAYDDDVISFYGGDVLLDAEQFANLTSVQKLAISFLQILNGLNAECLSEPFASEDKKTNEILPTTILLQWQKELLNCKSASQLALFFSIFEKAIKWKSLKKCNVCDKRIEGDLKKVMECRSCQKLFHFACSNAKRYIRTWDCFNCTGAESEKESAVQNAQSVLLVSSSDRGDALSDEEEMHNYNEKDEAKISRTMRSQRHMASTFSKNNGVTNGTRSMKESVQNKLDVQEEDEEFSSLSSQEGDDDFQFGNGVYYGKTSANVKDLFKSASEARCRPSVTRRITVPTTSFSNTKELFKNELVNDYLDKDEYKDGRGRKRRAAAKRFIDYAYDDDDCSMFEESGSDSPIVSSHAKLRKISSVTSNRSLRIRKPSLTTKTSTNSEPFNYRHVSMGLRESDDQRRTQLKSCELLIREAMAKPFGEPFAFPVDVKYVPHYYEVIKNPMDLRTMINKLKNFDYDTPEGIWGDCRLMLKNCAKFNEENSPVRQCAEELEKFLKERFEEIVGHAVE